MIKMVINSTIVIVVDFYKFICTLNQFEGIVTGTFIYMGALRIKLLNI